APVACFDEDTESEWTLLSKFSGHLFAARQGHTPFDVVAWHGLYYPYKYDLGRFNTVGSISYDHPDPSIFTRQEILNDFEKKVGELRSVFALADPQNHAPRETPDHLIDTITFEPMHDPVVTKNGHSYERATLMEHLKLSPTDPLTREPLTVNELRPNLGLRAACEEFWESAGSWAGDW
ncbi:hypothetical protein LTR28_001358, partial [Elasticomyces elasticus]